LFVQRALTLAVAGLGLAWGILTLPQSEAADDLRYIESRLLRFETFSPSTVAQTLDSPVSRNLSACDTHSQRAMLLMELPLAEAALRAGSATEFDRHIRSLETRSRRILSCTPRESFVWLLAFDLEVLHGQLKDHSFDLLAMSYETSPNEAWISIRRNTVAMPLVLDAPEMVRRKVLSEFQQLARNGFAVDAARSYLAAPQPIRSLLQTRIEQLAPPLQKAFSEELQRLRP
jgi:hypothetical protein